MKAVYLLSFMILILLTSAFADSNGVWHLAQDVRPGIMGSDENATSSLTNFTFVNNVYFEDNVDMDSVVANNINTNAITTTTATTNILTATSIALNGVAISGSGANILIGANRILTNVDLIGYATENYVTSQNYITSSALSGYATESYVVSQINAMTVYNNCGWRAGNECNTGELLNGYDSSRVKCCGPNDNFGCTQTSWETYNTYCNAGTPSTCGTTSGVYVNEQRRTSTSCKIEYQSVTTSSICKKSSWDYTCGK